MFLMLHQKNVKMSNFLRKGVCARTSVFDALFQGLSSLSFPETWRANLSFNFLLEVDPFLAKIHP